MFCHLYQTRNTNNKDNLVTICSSSIMLDVFSLFHRLCFNCAQWQSACALSIKHTVLGSISSGDQIFLILYCLKKACERERIHLMSKKKAEKEFVKP